MDTPISILAFAGSTREASLNKKLIRAAHSLVEPGQASMTVIDLRDYPLPLYDGDLEDAEGLPQNAAALKRVITEHDALLISTPEYNGSLPAVLKNTIDWLSRPGGDDDLDPVWKERPTALLSASPGGLGGIRSLSHLRPVLLNLGAFIIPAQFALASAGEAFDESGRLKNEGAADKVRQVVAQLIKTVRGLDAVS